MKNLTYLIISLLLLLAACVDVPAQQGDLCPGEPSDLSPVGEVNWPRAVYLESPGREHLVAVESVDADGRATLLELGLDAETGKPRTGRVEGVPCLTLPVPSLIRRPRETWGYPTGDLLAAGSAIVFDDAVIIAGAGSPVKLASAPILQLEPGTWAPDPTGPMSAEFAAAFNAACMESP